MSTTENIDQGQIDSDYQGDNMGVEKNNLGRKEEATTCQGASVLGAVLASLSAQKAPNYYMNEKRQGRSTDDDEQGMSTDDELDGRGISESLPIVAKTPKRHGGPPKRFEIKGNGPVVELRGIAL